MEPGSSTISHTRTVSFSNTMVCPTVPRVDYHYGRNFHINQIDRGVRTFDLDFNSHLIEPDWRHIRPNGRVAVVCNGRLSLLL